MEQTGIPDQLVEEFVEHLERRGRGTYTVRSYRLGLSDFSRWLQRAGDELDAVSRRDVEAYIGEFAAGPGRAGRRAGGSTWRRASRFRCAVPRGRSTTAVLVLASFFAFLIDRDEALEAAAAG